MNKSVYFTCISGVQKAIRLGLTDKAIYLGKIAYFLDPKAFISRLWTILLEDCALDRECLEKFYSFSFKSEDDVLDALRILSNSKKTREGIAAAKIILGSDELDIFTKTRLLEQAPIFVKCVDDWELYGLGMYSDIIQKDNFISLQVAQKAKKYDRERLYSGVPYLYTTEGSKNITHKEFNVNAIFLGDHVVSSSFDGHTHFGLQAFSIVWREIESEAKNFKLTQDNMKRLVFYNEGILTTNMCKTHICLWDLVLLLRGHSEWVSGNISNWFIDRVKPKLDSVRKWQIDKIKDVRDTIKYIDSFRG